MQQPQTATMLDNEDSHVETSIEIIFASLTADLPTKKAKRPGSSKSFDKHKDEDAKSKQSHAGTTETHPADSVDSHEDQLQEVDVDSDAALKEKAIFDKARHYLNPGMFFRFFTYLYAERKLLTFFCVHFVITLVVWGEYHKC